MTFLGASGAVFGGLFVLFHPFGTWPIFLAVTKDRTTAERNRVRLHEALCDVRNHDGAPRLPPTGPTNVEARILQG